MKGREERRGRLGRLLQDLDSRELREASELGRSFRLARSRLQEQIQGELARGFFRGPREEEVDRLDEQVAQLAAAAPEFTDLVRQGRELAREVDGLRAEAGGREANVAAWLGRRAEVWEAVLRDLGKDIYRQPEIRQHRERRERILAEVRLTGLALAELGRLARILPVLKARLAAGQVAAAPLAAQLAQLQERILTGPGEEAPILEMRRLLTPLEGLEAPEAPRPAVGLGQILGEIRDWTGALEAGEDRLSPLGRDDEALGRAREAWDLASLFAADRDLSGRSEEWSSGRGREDGSSPDALLAEAREHLAELQRVGQALRQDRRAFMARQIDALADACGQQPDLTENLTRLAAATVTDPFQHGHWCEGLEQLYQTFRATAGGQQEKLRDDLARKREALGKRVEEAGRLLPSAPLRLEVRRARQAIEDTGQPNLGWEAILAALYRLRGLIAELTRLLADGAEAREALAERQEALAERRHELAEAARQAALEPPTLGGSPTLDEAETLEEAGELLDAFADALATAEEGFAAACRAALTADLESCLRIASTLALSGFSAPDLPSPEALAEDTSAWVGPRAAGSAVARMKEALGHHDEAARGALAEIRGALAALGGRLRELGEGALGPEERARAGELLAALEKAAGEAAPEGAGRGAVLTEVTAGAALLGRGENFLHDLFAAEETARELAASLRRRLASFGEEELPRPGGALFTRVEGLIYGIPENPRSWTAAGEQLRHAGALLRRLEIHGRRLAAARFEAHARGLRQAVGRVDDPSLARNVDEALGEVVRLPATDFPPLVLRRRVADLVRRLRLHRHEETL